MTVARDDFSNQVRELAARRVGFRCSNPSCRHLTSGPTADPARTSNIGVVAHITAASPGGPRFDSTLSSEARCSSENAIWLCQNCGALVDRDVDRFTVAVLREWKILAERAASIDIGAGSEFRPIAAGEVRQELTIGELAVVKELSQEFGCHVETDVHVPAGNGWLSVHAAVVRGEDLVAIEIREHHGHGIPYFQIEHLIELGTTLKFERFSRFALYVVVVSDGPEETDHAVRERLESIARAASCEVNVRLYRLNALRAKHGL